MASAPLTALIVDDEPLARQELKYLLDRAGGVSVVAQGANGIEAVDLIRTHKPDVVFLDVRMPGLDGFAVIRKLLSAEHRAPLPQVVFATAFDQYAVKAFEVNAVDYLLKPFDSKRLTKTLDKLRARIHTQEDASVAPAAPSVPMVAAVRPPEREPDAGAPAAPNPAIRLWEVAQAKLDTLLRMVEEQSFSGAAAGHSPARSGRVVLRLGDRLLLVDQKDVCFASIEEGRISVVTKTLAGDSNVRTLEELYDQLDPEQFWRAHRSYLVNLQHIREVLPWFKSTYKLRMDDQKGTEIPVSRSQTKRLRELFNL
jgi:two-component system, LytTR family, response regulator LytT